MANNGWFMLDQNNPSRNNPRQNQGDSSTGQQRTSQPARPSQGGTPQNAPNQSRPQGDSGTGQQQRASQPAQPSQGGALQNAPGQSRSQVTNQPARTPPQPGQNPPRPSGVGKSVPSQTAQEPFYPKAKDHTLTVGPDGTALLQDTKLHETLETFVHTKSVERAVHVKGFGAFGYFQTMQSMREYTKASIFQTAGVQIPVMTRFSLAVSTKGTPDSGRNVRGFSTKFYTNEGVFDLLCNHIPVFLVRDAIRFPDSIRAFLPSPVNNLADPERFWGFVASAPEATHFVTWLYSDVGTVKSLRRIRGHSVNTYVWRNAEGVRRFVKYHWLPLAGEEYIDRQEAGKLAGEDPDVAGRDLYNTIAKGTPVEYELRVQLMNLEDAQTLPFDPLDDTKIWDEGQYPLIPVGRLVLNRNPENYDQQIERVAFSPSNLLDGIELSDDKMLQGRSFIYWDAQRYRLGPDFRNIPVNKEAGFDPQVLPTSGLGRQVEGQVMRSELEKQDDFAQAGQRYLSLSPEEQEHLVDNIAVELPLVSKGTQNAVLDHLQMANEELANRVYQQMAKYAK